MFKSPAYMTIFASLYLLVFVVFIQLNIFIDLIHVLFFCSPAVVVSLLWSILRYGKYNGKALAEDEHWGYQDKPNQVKNS